MTAPWNAPFVQTVLGPVAPESLGRTLTHEHVFVDWDYARGVGKQLASVAPLEKAIGHLDDAAEAGIGSIIDCSSEQFAGSPLLLRAAAAASRVQIIAATGIFNADSLPVPGWAYTPGTVDDIADHFVRAASHGLAGSGVRPGIIKIATSGRAIGEIEEKALAAAAKAQARIGIGITTHTEMSKHALEQVSILVDNGADVDRVVIGHMGWGSTPADRDMHLAVAATGVTLGFDCMGSPDIAAADWVTMIADLVEAGFGDQIVMAHDTMLHSVGLETVWEGGWSSGDLTHVPNVIVPQLGEAGVSDETIETILVASPRRVLTVDPARYPGAVAFSTDLMGEADGAQ